jgi:hypothetical protein
MLLRGDFVMQRLRRFEPFLTFPAAGQGTIQAE